MNYRKNSVRSIRTIYVEEAAFNYKITKDVLFHNPFANVISIKNYKDMFNRNKQHFGIQKMNPTLILAVKKDSFVYRGSDMCQSFGYDSYYYATFMLNCIYDCSYCFLQGMYNSANIVAFVNIDDFNNEFSMLKEKAYIALSYETDLIAHNGIIPYYSYFYDCFKNNKQIIGEIRTKSANSNFYKTYKSLDNIIIAFTLTPNEIIGKYERYTPRLDGRIKAINTAIAEGYKVRICFDPIFADEPSEVYEDFYNYIFKNIDSGMIYDIGYGFFRMPKEYFNKISKINDSVVCTKDFVTVNGTVTYSDVLIESTLNKHATILEKYIDRERVFIT